MNKTCDLILLTWNHLEVTKKCLQSLFEHTDLPSRLVIVDNGSDQPGAKEYLQSVQPAGNVQEVVFIRNEEDLGFSKGMNTGLRFCLERQPAAYLCLVSNDVIVTENWLSELSRVAELKPDIGLVNPNSTNFGLYPAGVEKINEYGIKVARSLKGKWQELGSCIGFCFLVKKEVFEKIGFLDEAFGMAYYEDADFSKRAQAAGYLCVLAEGSYVYHEQGKSFGKHQEKSPLFLKNEELFYSRWGMAKPGRIGYILGGRHIGIPRSLYEEIRESANQFNKIWVLTKEKKDNSDLPNHWNVQKIFFRGPAFLFGFWSLIYLLVKKKKFNAVFVDPLNLLKFLKKLQKRYQTELKLLSSGLILTNDERRTTSDGFYIICGVERGWKGMRQFALALADKGYEVDLFLREKVSIELLKVISPRKGIRVIPCGKKIFPFRLFGVVIQRMLTHKVKWLVFNRKDRLRKLNWFAHFIGARCLVLEEAGNGYRLLFQGRELDAKEADLLLVRRM